MTTIPTGHAVRVSGEPHNSNIDDLPVHFRSIQAPYSVRDVDDRCSVYSTLNTKDVEAMLSKGLDRFYEKFKNLSKRVNVHLPTPEVRFHDLSYSVECNIEKTKSVTVGGQLLSFLTPFTKKKSVNRTILHPMSGIIKPGTMTLVLGGQSSGKSTLLKALANKLRTSSRSEMQGSVQYSGLSADQIELNKLVGLVDQNDTHTATLTVRETFQFADTCLNGKVENQPEQLKEVAALRTELILHLLGMVRCAETVVGDALLRGVSGGERKRVTIGEVLVGGQSVFVCDEISTGLDSATTFDIMDSIRTWTKTLGGTAIVALLQPPPEVVELFDDILLMEQGHLVYHGPRENILSYFQSIGFSCPIKIDPADFLIDVISGGGYQYRNGEVSEQDLPLSINDFERCFRESSLFKEESKALSAGYQLPTTYETAEQFKQFKSVANLAQTKKEGGTTFGLSWMDELKLLAKRESTIYVRDKPLVYGKMMEAIVVGLLLGSIYYKADASLFLRMVFFNIAIFQRQAWQQLAVAFGLRAVFYKQRSRNFFRTSSYCVASSLVQIPINIMVSFTMCVIFYFMSGLHRNAGTFFVYLLILIAFQHAIGAYFTFLTTISPSITVAQAAAGASVCFFLLFSGNIILYHLIPSYWIWMYWFNPLAWALRSAMLNEFHSHYNDAQAHIKLSAFQMEKFDKEYIWIGVAVLFLYYVFFIFLQSLALHFICFEKKVRLTHEDMADEMKSTASVAEVILKVPNTGKYVRTMDNKPGKAAEIGFVPAYLCVRNLSYFVPNPAGEGELQLLHNVTAHFEPGYMTALMGQTGAGKTTLMDVVAGRKTGGRIEGDILVNGLLKDPQTFSRVAGYCEQMDIHSYGATVYEALVFSANLRLPHETSKQSRLDIVQDTIQLLELEPIQHHMVGKNSSDGLSVEQRKRLTIGVELVANPSILFLDEPTSGLDSRSAQIVMRGVQSIARSGRTVVCTIHQPSVQIFELFDRLLLLKAGGFTAYYGPLGEDSRDMLTYFSSIPGTVKIQPRYNPATYMLEVIGAGIGRDTGETKDYSEAYRNSELYRENEAKTLSYCEPRPEFQKFPVMKPIATDCMTQIKELAKKTGLTYWRTPEYNFMRLMAYPIFAVVFGTTFYQMKNETDKNISSQVGLIYNCMDFIGVINLMTVVETTCAERAVYYRERMSNYYGALPYSLSLFFAEVPYLFTVSMIFVSSMYFLIGLDASAVIFFRFWVAFFLYVSVCTFAGQWMSCLMPNEKVAVVAVGALSAILNLLSGYLVPFKLMRTGFSWISHIFPSRYSFTALVSQQLSRCSDKGTEPGCKLIKVTGLNGITTNQRTADFVSNTYRISMQHVNMNYVALIIIILFLQVAIFLTLKYVSHLKR